VLAPGVPEAYLAAAGAPGPFEYEPAVLGEAELRYRRRGGTDEWVERISLVAWLDGDAPDWSAADETGPLGSRVSDRPVDPATWAPLPASVNTPASWRRWERELLATLVRDRRLAVYRHAALKLVSTPGETERDFRIRLQEVAREQRDDAVAKLRDRYGSKLATLDERLRKAELAVEREADQARTAGLQTAVSVGATLLSAFLGRRSTRSTIGRATTAARGASRTAQQHGDIGRAKENVGALATQREELAARFDEDVAALERKLDAQAEEIETIELAPRRTDTHVERVTLLWVPRGAKLPPPAAREITP
jgi:hypothetical protein